MPVTVKFDPASQTPQAQVIGDANCSQDGILSRALACKLINLPSGTVLGPLITAATTIAPTTTLAHVTGVTTIQTITPLTPGFVGDITLIPDDPGGFTTGTNGNIAKATAATQFRALKLTYDGTSWYPSY